MMKRFICLSLLTMLVIMAYSQVKTSDSKTKNIESFWAANLKLCKFENRLALFTGGSGAVVIDKLRIGLHYNGMAKTFRTKKDESLNYKYGSNFGGLFLSRPFIVKEKFQFVAELKLSYGTARTIDTNWAELSNDTFLGCAPSIGVEYKLSDILAISGGIEYAYFWYTKPITHHYYSETSLNSLGVFISLRLGIF